eukprot:gnl/TRDRNA2_/TRDRNA2_177303_c1_seq7.p2 gnl/TRDRNA2_/TRDRNA2_177303_c1~~gnl/TRDRNA2_/TRDRNA2_177303_c1_seq7.p2  ORF type:complete len:105 (-),score=7.00 gnl/TRDRNA2_/TRDRNA2_177303_c1_seq7:189-503(-)
MKGTSSTARTAKAQAVLESSRGPNSPSHFVSQAPTSTELLCYGRAACPRAPAEVSCERGPHTSGSTAQRAICGRSSGKIFTVVSNRLGFVSCSALSPLAKLREA